MKRIGSRAQVYHGNAIQTAGGLKKKELFKAKNGSIKSKKASNRAKRNKNLGKLLKQKGSGCFDYHKTVKTQLGGGKKKKNVDLEKHIYIFTSGFDTFTLPNKYKNAKLNYKCDCPFSAMIKHNISDHVEHEDMAMMNDKEMGFSFPKKCHYNSKELDKNCGCGLTKKKHKVKDHQTDKKPKKGGGKFGMLMKGMKTLKGLKGAKGNFGNAFKQLSTKGTALAAKAAPMLQQLKTNAAPMLQQAKAKAATMDMNKLQQGMQQATAIAQQGQQLASQMPISLPSIPSSPIITPIAGPGQKVIMVPTVVSAGKKRKKSKRIKSKK